MVEMGAESGGLEEGVGTCEDEAWEEEDNGGYYSWRRKRGEF